jgi:hypothetical protein
LAIGLAAGGSIKRPEGEGAEGEREGKRGREGERGEEEGREEEDREGGREKERCEKSMMFTLFYIFKRRRFH